MPDKPEWPTFWESKFWRVLPGVKDERLWTEGGICTNQEGAKELLKNKALLDLYHEQIDAIFIME